MILESVATGLSGLSVGILGYLVSRINIIETKLDNKVNKEDCVSMRAICNERRNEDVRRLEKSDDGQWNEINKLKNNKVVNRER